MPPNEPVRRVDFADIEELKKRFAEGGEVKFCRCFASKQFPYCDGSHVELNRQGITNAGPIVIKNANPMPEETKSKEGLPSKFDVYMKEVAKVTQSTESKQPSQPSNMPPDNPVRRVDLTGIETLATKFTEGGEVKFCRCMGSKNFPYCDGTHVELNKQGITNAGPLVVGREFKATPAPSVTSGKASCAPSNVPPENPVRRVDFTDLEEISRRVAQDGEVKFCRCLASKNFPYCDGSHVALNKQGISNAGPLVFKQEKPGAALPAECKSGDGSLENVGIKVNATFQCVGCKQKFDSDKVKEIHWRFAHDFMTYSD
jgi:CDGSH-type Zn-finger protein